MGEIDGLREEVDELEGALEDARSDLSSVEQDRDNCLTLLNLIADSLTELADTLEDDDQRALVLNLVQQIEAAA